MQSRLGLLREQSFRAGLRTLLFVGLAWAVPLLLSAIDGRAVGTVEENPFLLEPGVWSRYFISIGLFLLAEKRVEQQLRLYLRQFAQAPLLAPNSLEAAATAVSRALRKRDSGTAELACLLLAFVWTGATLTHVMHTGESSWALTVSAAGSSLTPAGWWATLFSNPLFNFLVLRWLWRNLVWGLLLRDLARLKMRLVASHPDGHGGLAFISQYPSVYVSNVFGLSCVTGAALIETMHKSGIELAIYGIVMALWLLLMIGIFALPLLAFHRPLSAVREQTMLACSAQASRHFRAGERAVLGQNIVAGEDAESAGTADISDPTKLFAAARTMSTIPLTREALLPISLAAVGPLVAAGATQFPLLEVVKIVKRLLMV